MSLIARANTHSLRNNVLKSFENNRKSRKKRKKKEFEF